MRGYPGIKAQIITNSSWLVIIAAMEPLSITVDLESLSPIACSPGLPGMLGYRSQWVCLRSFSRMPHIQGVNFLQLSRMAEDGGSLSAFALLDRQFNAVGSLRSVSIQPGTSRMVITVNDERSGADGTSAGRDPRNLLELYPDEGRVEISRDWLTCLGVQGGRNLSYERFFDFIVSEDLHIVRKVLAAEQLPTEHSLRYRLVSRDGRVIPVEHVFRTLYLADGTRCLSGGLRETDISSLQRFNLATLALDSKLTASGNESITLRSFAGFKQLIKVVEDCHAEEQLTPSIVLRAGTTGGSCVLCEQDLVARPVVEFLLRGFRLSQESLKHLPLRDYSETRLGERASWKRLFQLAHDEGYHVGLRTDPCSSLVISLAGKEGP